MDEVGNCIRVHEIFLNLKDFKLKDLLQSGCGRLHYNNN